VETVSDFTEEMNTLKSDLTARVDAIAAGTELARGAQNVTEVSNQLVRHMTTTNLQDAAHTKKLKELESFMTGVGDSLKGHVSDTSKSLVDVRAMIESNRKSLEDASALRKLADAKFRDLHTLCTNTFQTTGTTLTSLSTKISEDRAALVILNEALKARETDIAALQTGLSARLETTVYSKFLETYNANMTGLKQWVDQLKADEDAIAELKGMSHVHTETEPVPQQIIVQADTQKNPEQIALSQLKRNFSLMLMARGVSLSEIKLLFIFLTGTSYDQITTWNNPSALMLFYILFCYVRSWYEMTHPGNRFIENWAMSTLPEELGSFDKLAAASYIPDSMIGMGHIREVAMAGDIPMSRLPLLFKLYWERVTDPDIRVAHFSTQEIAKYMSSMDKGMQAYNGITGRSYADDYRDGFTEITCTDEQTEILRQFGAAVKLGDVQEGALALQEAQQRVATFINVITH
jgi:hypothetical protein